MPDSGWEDGAADAPGNVAGFSLHAGVAVKSTQREKLERLCRYIGGEPDCLPGLDHPRRAGWRLHRDGPVVYRQAGLRCAFPHREAGAQSLQATVRRVDPERPSLGVGRGFDLDLAAHQLAVFGTSLQPVLPGGPILGRDGFVAQQRKPFAGLPQSLAIRGHRGTRAASSSAWIRAQCAMARAMYFLTIAAMGIHRWISPKTASKTSLANWGDRPSTGYRRPVDGTISALRRCAGRPCCTTRWSRRGT